MDDMLALAQANLTSPMVLFFALGFVAAMARSDLSFPEAAAKTLSLYLLFAIGFKGGAGVAEHGIDLTLGLTLFAGTILSAIIPLIAFYALRVISGLSLVDAAAVAAHYGSISIVTFVAATSALTDRGIAYEGYMVAVAALMETPAILVALWLARSAIAERPGSGQDGGLMREIMLNGSIVMLTGAFIIGWITGAEGLDEVSGLIIDPFKGVLCLFLLDMGLVAGRGMRTGARHLSAPVIMFGLLMPLLGSVMGGVTGAMIGLSPGGIALLATLSASASYIAVPAAMRVALPEANPSIYLTLSLGVTFPFNLTVGIPLYIAMAQTLGGS
ncbi:MAG: sodium-dependent bicarbonate transport family permease [Paracoccaceae bacterium]